MSHIDPIAETIKDLKKQGTVSPNKLVALSLNEALGKLSEADVEGICESLRQFQAEEWDKAEKRQEQQRREFQKQQEFKSNG